LAWKLLSSPAQGVRLWLTLPPTLQGVVRSWRHHKVLLQASQVLRPHRPELLGLDKGCDDTDAEAAVRGRRITPHIRRIGEQPLLGCVQGRPRRWVVERTSAWHDRFRGLLVRWERIGTHDLGLLHLACALIAFRQAQ
jgi:IS5 family transposase